MHCCHFLSIVKVCILKSILGNSFRAKFCYHLTNTKVIVNSNEVKYSFRWQNRKELQYCMHFTIDMGIWHSGKIWCAIRMRTKRTCNKFQQQIQFRWKSTHVKRGLLHCNL
jgi:hypothetical protein